MKYVSSHAVEYVAPNNRGYLSLPILHFLWGHPWDDLAINFVHSVNPRCIRVVLGEEKTDAILSRVTVYVKQGTDIIERITQEVEVGLEGDYDHGHALCIEAVKRGMDVR